MAVGNHMMTLRQKALLIKLLNQKGKHVHVAPDWADFTNTRGWEVVVERRIKISKWSKLWPHCHIAALLLSHSANTVMSSAVSSPAFWSCTSLVFIAATAHQTQHNMRESRILQTQQAGILCTMSIGLLTVPGNRYIGNVIAVLYCTGLDRRTWWIQVFVSWKNFFYRYAFRFYGSSVCRVQA